MINLVLLTGFLGSGKTTLMRALGKKLMAKGQRVAFITNDQTETLVDTEFLRQQDIPLEEVSAGCFCCNFEALTDKIFTIAENHSPDYILAEAVGSCTDVSATVILPLQRDYPGRISISEYFTLVDGVRVTDEYAQLDLLDPVSPKETLVAHQLKEANSLILTKSDFLDTAEIRAAEGFLSKLNPKADIHPVSTLEDAGVDALVNRITHAQNVQIERTIPLDYAIYAKAEAEYGWYNGSWNMAIPEDAIPAIGGKLLEILRDDPLVKEVAHAKLLLGGKSETVKISLTAGKIQLDSSAALHKQNPLRVILNIRAKAAPDYLSRLVEQKMFGFLGREKISNYRYSALIPAPPQPTHRIEKTVAGF